MAIPQEKIDEPGRRRFLQWVIRASAALIAAVTVIPGIGMALAPVLASSRPRRKRVLFKNPQDAQSPTVVSARIEGTEETAPGIYYKRLPDGSPWVVSAVCTHAGCAVQWRGAENEFYCPCHQGRYNSDGKNIAGPPPRPLDRLPAQVVTGEIYVEEPGA